MPQVYDQDPQPEQDVKRETRCTHRKAKDISDFSDLKRGVRVFSCPNCGIVEMPCSQ
jgi:hypothetical protein